MSSGVSMAQRLKVLRRAFKHDPSLVLDYARWFFWSGTCSSDRYAVPGALSHDEALRRLDRELGSYDPGPAMQVVQSWKRQTAAGPAERRARQMMGDPSLGELAYQCVRAVRPDVVIETGVATGVTSAHILAALEDNGHGELHSIDIPPTELLLADQVGAEIPEELRGRWTYHWAGARRLLPRLLAEKRGRVGVFVHDSDHKYEHMVFELRAALAGLTPPAVILADDVDANQAFAEVASGRDPIYVSQRDKPGSTGVLLLR